MQQSFQLLRLYSPDPLTRGSAPGVTLLEEDAPAYSTNACYFPSHLGYQDKKPEQSDPKGPRLVSWSVLA